jgi:hypothetical protein
MKVDDLKTLSGKLLAHIQKERTESLFQEFLQVLTTSLRGNRQQPVSQQKDKLYASLRSFDNLSLTYSEAGLFSVLGYGEFVGDSAVRDLDTILHDENFDPAGVLNKIDAKQKAFQQFTERNSSLTTALQRVPVLKDVALRKGEALLEVTFTDKAAVDNIVDFEGWIDCWTKIIRAFSELAGERPESARIVFVQKSSPLVLDLATASGLVLLIGKAVDAVLIRVERYLSIRKQVEEIKKLKLENKQIEKELEKEADAFSEKSAHEITSELTAGMKPKPDGAVINGLSMSVKNLFLFIDKGGRVDCPSSTGDDNKGVADLFTEVRKLQKAVDQLRLLPAPRSQPKTEK